MTTSPLLLIDDLGMAYPGNQEAMLVLDGITFSLEEGRFLAVVGPNGCGKTTLLHIIAGFLQPTSGQVLLNGEPIRCPGPDRPIVLQDLALFYWMTVWSNATFGLMANGKRSASSLKAAQMWLENMGLWGFRNHYPFELSGGMKQKLAIARALVLEPALLIMDEPFANLDARTREKLQEELGELLSRVGKTTLLVTHNIEEAVFMADTVIVLTDRPARVLEEVQLPWPRPRPQDARTAAEFFEAKNRIWHLLTSSKREN